ncbi:hypothetical protein OG948_00060 [Embleya sp. NBC_00888]|uniref:hypothetical protein n=1 Tax=Embleya sp. NBC_00888 TaxID=2975960 RepID=UPI00386BB573|nr:hypothetical protein OG948_00060 [Embleya sp. NBC_00888]
MTWKISSPEVAVRVETPFNSSVTHRARLPSVMICGGVSVEIRRGFVSGVESAFRLVVWGAGLGGPLTVGADLLLTLLTNHRVG